MRFLKTCIVFAKIFSCNPVDLKQLSYQKIIFLKVFNFFFAAKIAFIPSKYLIISSKLKLIQKICLNTYYIMGLPANKKPNKNIGLSLLHFYILIIRRFMSISVFFNNIMRIF